MEKENQLIVPTQDIAFAVLKDGSRITNFSDGGGNPKIEPIMKTFEGIAKYFEEAPEKEFIAASLAWMIAGGSINGVLHARAERIKADLNKD